MRATGTRLSTNLVTYGSMETGSPYSPLSLFNQCGNPWQARVLYKQLETLGSGQRHNGYIFIELLKACTQLKDLHVGMELHADAARLGYLESDPFVGSTLVDMYAKCGSLTKAQQTFQDVPFRDMVSCTALMAGYIEYGYGDKALECFEQMKQDGVSPNAVALACSLKACGRIGANEKGLELHGEIERRGLLEEDVFLGSTLVDMYANCGLLDAARVVLKRLPMRNVVSWTALIGGYVSGGYSEEALECYEEMRLDGITPNGATFLCILKACGNLKDEEKGIEIQAEVERWGLLEVDILVGSSLVDMFMKCGSLRRAQQVFKKLPVRNVITWNVLMTGYSELGNGEEALKCLDTMQSENVLPNSITYLCCLKACCSLRDTDKGQGIHEEIERKGLLEMEEDGNTLGNALIDMYAKCRLLPKAHQVFAKLPVRTTVSWNVLISGYAGSAYGEEALRCFEQMLVEGVIPSSVTLVSALKACGIIGAMIKGQGLHAEIVSMGLLEKNLLVVSSLVDMYSKCGSLLKARQVFETLPDRDVVSWTSLIAGYADHGQGDLALNFLEVMRLDDISPNAVTFTSGLKACGTLRAVGKGQDLHVEVEREGLLDTDVCVGNTLIDMYAKCGLLTKAQELFDKLPLRNVVLWNTLLTAYARHKYYEDGLDCFKRMQAERDAPNLSTFVCMLNACGRVGAADKGQEIHGEIARHGMYEGDVAIGNGLVAMYAKCGKVGVAHHVFDKLVERDIIACNSLMAGYAQLGESKSVLSVFERVIQEGIQPDVVTFLNILNVCSRVGLSSTSEMYYEAMSRDYGVAPVIDHLSCMVDILGHAGQWDKAARMIKEMGKSTDQFPLLSALSACWNYGNLDLGKLAFQQARS